MKDLIYMRFAIIQRFRVDPPTGGETSHLQDRHAIGITNL
jgi:hypothetical protein